MRTYSHGVIGYLLYAKRPPHERRLAVIGSLMPDALLALGFIPHYAEYVTQAAVVVELHTLLHHSALHLVTVSLHSFVIIGPLLALAYWLYKPAVPCLVGMLAHGVVDLLTHRQWAYNHLFPLSFHPYVRYSRILMWDLRLWNMRVCCSLESGGCGSASSDPNHCVLE